MKLDRLVFAAFSAFSILASTRASDAVCGQGTGNLSSLDQTMFSVHGCDWVFLTYHDGAYHLHSGDWTSRGWNDACNINLEYAKHWNAAWIVERGLADNNDFSFHGTTDYRQLSVGNDSIFHSEFYHNIGDNTNAYGSYYDVGSIDRSVTTYCPLYDITLDFRGNPASRASDYVHEAWHSWQKKYGYSGHQNGPVLPNCTVSGSSCDYWYPHGIGAFAFGNLWMSNYNATPKLFHSANQVQVEFLCDLAEFHQPYIPVSASLVAQSDANDRSNTRFINGPGFHCGEPRPW